MNGFPWLTVAGAVPLAGALVIALISLPVAAMVTTREIHDRAVGTLERSYVHQSTFGRNRLSMAAGLAAIILAVVPGCGAFAAAQKGAPPASGSDRCWNARSSM